MNNFDMTLHFWCDSYQNIIIVFIKKVCVENCLTVFFFFPFFFGLTFNLVTVVKQQLKRISRTVMLIYNIYWVICYTQQYPNVGKVADLCGSMVNNALSACSKEYVNRYGDIHLTIKLTCYCLFKRNKFVVVMAVD